jgi:hypothetical protein
LNTDLQLPSDCSFKHVTCSTEHGVSPEHGKMLACKKTSLATRRAIHVDDAGPVAAE